MRTRLLKPASLAQKLDALAVAAGYTFVMFSSRPFLAVLTLMAFALPLRAEIVPLDDISAYLNRLTTARAEFTQVNSDGSFSFGTVYIKRPGRARFEYAPPDKNLVVVGGSMVAIFDEKSNQPPEQYPLKRTPLNIILGDNIDLGRADMVAGHVEFEGTTRVLAQDPENPEYGRIELVFSPEPLALREWIITDDLGNQTSIVLGEIVEGEDFPPSYFNITAEVEKRR